MIDMERGAALSGSRFAYLRGELVFVELALVRWVLEKLRGHGFEPVIPPVLVREQALYGTASCPTPSSRSTACPTTSSTSSAPARSRSRRCTPARSSTAPSCRAATPASPLLPPRGGRRRARTRAASSACTSSTRSRCSASSSRRLAGRARAAARDRGGDPGRARDPLPRRRHRRRRPRQLGREEVRPRGVAAGPGALSRADLVLEHDRLPGAATGHPHRAEAAASPRSLHTLNGTAVAVGAHVDRAARERPARGRRGRAAGGADRVRRSGPAAGGRGLDRAFVGEPRGQRIVERAERPSRVSQSLTPDPGASSRRRGGRARAG